MKFIFISTSYFSIYKLKLIYKLFNEQSEKPHPKLGLPVVRAHRFKLVPARDAVPLNNDGAVSKEEQTVNVNISACKSRVVCQTGE